MKVYNHQNDWFYEGQISKMLVDYLINKGYTILKDNSNKISDRGEDIIVSIDGKLEIIEVKGYPTTFYTKGKQKGEVKRTNPKLQAKHSFSEALLSSIFNYQKQKVKGDITLALAFPLNSRYKELISKVEDFFTDNNLSFKVYFIDENGTITIDNLNKNLRTKNNDKNEN